MKNRKDSIENATKRNKITQHRIRGQVKKLIELGQKHYNVYQILSWHNILGTTDLEFYDSSFKRPRRYAKKSQSNDN